MRLGGEESKYQLFVTDHQFFSLPSIKTVEAVPKIQPPLCFFVKHKGQYFFTVIGK
jgi:hypothetical protein